MDPGEGTPSLGTPRAVPGQLRPYGPGVKPTMMSQCQSTFGTERVVAWGCGTHHGMQGKSIWADNLLWGVYGGTKGG